MNDKIKRCRRCGFEKTLDQFPAQAKKADGVASWCRDCKRADALERYNNNREVYMERSRLRRAALKENKQKGAE